MSKKPGSKDEALEALDFIVNVLKEHEKDLDRLINELGTVTDALGETGELTCKVEKVEERINGLQNEINGLVKYLSSSPRQAVAPVLADEPKIDKEKTEVAPASMMHGPPVILRCKQWEDFQTLASKAQTLSFMYKDAEKTFQADALKGNQIVTYSGELPKLIGLLKIWLSKQLDVPEPKILEGVLAIG